VVTVTHDEILSRLARPWVDIVPSRRATAKRSWPAHAHEPSPNVIVSALPADRTALAVTGQFRLRHRKPRFNEAHVPAGYAWQFLAPGGGRLLLFTWANWLRNSRQMFEDFCRETGREFGTLLPDGSVALGGRTIPFRECRIVHESELRPRPPASVECKPAGVILAWAERLLRARASRSEDIDYRELFDDEEARDDDLQARLEENLRANLSRYELGLTTRYGPPAAAGPRGHRDIPINGVLRHAIWTVGKRSLYLALSHEDRELPWVVCLGVKV
jgi:hypothetical protein